MTGRITGHWPGMRTAIAYGAVGLLLAGGAAAVQLHASRAATYEPAEAVELAGTEPAFIVGVVNPGSSSPTTTCTIRFADSSSGTMEVGIRESRSRPIPAGRRLPSGATSVTCDQRFSVSTGRAVLAYPLAGSATTGLAYGMLVILGFALAVQHRRMRRAGLLHHQPETLAVAAEPTAGPMGDNTGSTPSADTSTAAFTRWRTLTVVLLLLPAAGTASMLALAVTAADQPFLDPALNLLLLLVVAPATVGAALLSRRQPPA